MPKSKPAAKTTDKTKKDPLKPIEGLEKIIEIDTEEKEADIELVPGEIADEDLEDDEEGGLDEEEIDPFKDKWEE